MNTVPPTGKDLKKFSGFVFGFRFAQNPPSDTDDGIRRQYPVIGPVRGDRLAFRQGKPFGERTRRFPVQRCFVYVGRNNLVGNDPDLGQKLDASRRRGGEHQPVRPGNPDHGLT